MEGLFGVLVIGGMIVLRLIVPLGITFAFGYALRRLDTKWHPKITNNEATSVEATSVA